MDGLLPRTRLALALCLAAALALCSAGARAQSTMTLLGVGGSAPSSETFVGPFANWLCARSAASGTCGAAAGGYYNAAGDGTTDDTAALQNCLNALNATHPVCWVPAGTYKITSTLILGGTGSPATGAQYINLIGADPATTSLIWAGINKNGPVASTTSANDFIYTVLFNDYHGSIGAGSGWTGLTGASSSLGLTVEYQQDASPQTNLTGTWTPGADIHGAVMDAVVPSGGSPPTVDGSALTGAVGLPATVSLSTGSAGPDVIVVACDNYQDGAGVTGVSSTHTANWSLRTAANNLYLFYGTASGQLTNEQITISGTGSVYCGVFALAGANTTQIHDANASLLNMWTIIGSSMFYFNGVAYSRFDRLTFNGENTGNNGFDQSYVGSGGYFDVGNEYADDRFENFATGLYCGFMDYGCVDSAILRDRFLNNSVAGVSLGNYNALGMNVWDSYFQNNYDGVTNYGGAGNYFVIGSVFSGDIETDTNIGNAGVFGLRNNYSSGSGVFLDTRGGGGGAPNTLMVQDNAILDTTTSANTLSLYQGNLGPDVLLDNTVRSRADVVSGPIVQLRGPGTLADAFSLDDTFTAGSLASPCTMSGPVYSGGHCHEIGDQVVARGTLNPLAPVLPGTLPNITGQITVDEETTARTEAQIQADVNAICARNNGSVVHLQAGTYSWSSTLTVPANEYCQIIGDGFYTQITWTPTSGTAIQLTGPSKAVLRELLVQGSNGTADGIDVTDADQPGSRVFMQQPFLSQSKTNLFVDSLDYTRVELDNFYHNETALYSGGGAASLDVVGGALAAAGNWQGGETLVFDGDASNNSTGYAVSNGGHLLVWGTWSDQGSAGGQIVTATGPSTLTIADSQLYTPPGVATAVSLNDFTGTAALAGVSTDGALDVTGTGTGAQIAVLGMLGNGTQDTNPAPGAPSLSATTGSLSGTVYVETACVDPGGITVASAESSLAVTSQGVQVAAPTNCAAGTTGYYVFAATASGSEQLQQTAGSPTALGSPYVLGTTLKTSTGAPPRVIQFSNTASPAGTTEFVNPMTTAVPPSGTGAAELAEQGCCDTAFLTATLAPLRTAQPALPTPLPPGVTDARFYRVSARNFGTGIHLMH